MKESDLQVIDDAIEILANQTDKISIHAIGQVREVFPILANIMPELKQRGYASKLLADNQDGKVFELTRKDIRKAVGFDLSIISQVFIDRLLQGDETARDKAIGCLRQLKVVIEDTRRTRTNPKVVEKRIRDFLTLWKREHPTKLPKLPDFTKGTDLPKQTIQQSAVWQGIMEERKSKKGQKRPKEKPLTKKILSSYGTKDGTAEYCGDHRKPKHTSYTEKDDDERN